MKNLYSSEFCDVAINDDDVLFFMWKNTTEHMDAKNYKHEVKEYAKVLYKLRPSRTLTDVRQMQFIILPELQDWARDEVFKDGIITERSAFLVSPDFFVHVSVEQGLEEIDEKTHRMNEVIKYFEDEQEALAWLKN